MEVWKSECNLAHQADGNMASLSKARIEDSEEKSVDHSYMSHSEIASSTVPKRTQMT